MKGPGKGAVLAAEALKAKAELLLDFRHFESRLGHPLSPAVGLEVAQPLLGAQGSSLVLCQLSGQRAHGVLLVAELVQGGVSLS